MIKFRAWKGLIVVNCGTQSFWFVMSFTEAPFYHYVMIAAGWPSIILYLLVLFTFSIRWSLHKFPFSFNYLLKYSASECSLHCSFPIFGIDPSPEEIRLHQTVQSSVKFCSCTVEIKILFLHPGEFLQSFVFWTSISSSSRNFLFSPVRCESANRNQKARKICKGGSTRIYSQTQSEISAVECSLDDYLRCCLLDYISNNCSTDSVHAVC